jgi:hypothetical protein
VFTFLALQRGESILAAFGARTEIAAMVTRTWQSQMMPNVAQTGQNARE